MMYIGRLAVLSTSMRLIYHMEFSKEPSTHAGQIQSGISANGYVKTVLDAVAAVGEVVDVVRGRGRTTVNGTEATVPRHVAVVFANNSAVMNFFCWIEMTLRMNVDLPMKVNFRMKTK